VTFTAANWNIRRPSPITGVNDALDDGDIVYDIRHRGGDEQRQPL
jgi:hypothetical protein